MANSYSAIKTKWIHLKYRKEILLTRMLRLSQKEMLNKILQKMKQNNPLSKSLKPQKRPRPRPTLMKRRRSEQKEPLLRKMTARKAETMKRNLPNSLKKKISTWFLRAQMCQRSIS